jgi:hypothetical protein
MSYHSLASAIIYFVLSALNGCELKHPVNLSRPLERSESVLCTGQPNYKMVEGNNQYLVFRIQVNHSVHGKPDSVSVNVGKLNRSLPDGPSKSLGEHLKKDDQFNFQGASWEILQFGDDGIDVNGERVCRYGFLHIKQLSP